MTKEAIAVFDFDGTITTKDSFLEFIKFSRSRWSLYFGIFLFSPMIIAMKLGFYPNWKTKQHVFSFFYKDVSIEAFNDWGKNFTSEIEKLIRPKALEKLKFHKTSGDKIIIISASIENWITHWAAETGADLVLATKIEINNDGLLTGRFFSKNCYGQEKVNRLLELFPNRNEYKLIVYGDSLGDRELMKISDESFYNTFI